MSTTKSAPGMYIIRPDAENSAEIVPFMGSITGARHLYILRVTEDFSIDIKTGKRVLDRVIGEIVLFSNGDKSVLKKIVLPGTKNSMDDLFEEARSWYAKRRNVKT